MLITYPNDYFGIAVATFHENFDEVIQGIEDVKKS